MKSKGFTFIELIIVILIMGIIAAIAIPQIDKIMKGREAATQTLITGDSTPKNTTQVTPESKTSDGDWKVSGFDRNARTKQITHGVVVLEYEGSQYIISMDGGIIKHR